MCKETVSHVSHLFSQRLRADQYRLTIVVVIYLMVFIFTRDSIYAIARICYRPSVCLSVRPSHGWII